MAEARLSDARDPQTLGRRQVRGRAEVRRRLGDKGLCFVWPTFSATITMTDDTDLGEQVWLPGERCLHLGDPHGTGICPGQPQPF